MATVAVPRSRRRFAQLRSSDALLAGVTLVGADRDQRLRPHARDRRLLLDGRGPLRRHLLARPHGHPGRAADGTARRRSTTCCCTSGWTSFGRSETAVHWLSLTAALLTIPAAMWAGWSLWGKRAGYIGAALCALLPFLTAYGEEARMYALMALLRAAHERLLPACLRPSPPRLHRRLRDRSGADALHAQLGDLLRRRRVPRARVPVADRPKGGARRAAARRRARVRRRRAALPAVGADAALPGRAHRRSVGEQAAARRPDPDRERRARRLRPRGRGAARGRLRARGGPGRPPRTRRPRAAVGRGRWPRSRSSRSRSAGASRRCRRRGPRATSPRSSARWCC